MSIETWKAEFYPRPAQAISEEDALDHSIRKWEGLQPDALEKHVLFVVKNLIWEISSRPSSHKVGRKDCALCVQYLVKVNHLDDCCERCPIFKFRGSACCEGVGNPWYAFMKGNAAPMLDLLRQVKKGL